MPRRRKTPKNVDDAVVRQASGSSSSSEPQPVQPPVQPLSILPVQVPLAREEMRSKGRGAAGMGQANRSVSQGLQELVGPPSQGVPQGSVFVGPSVQGSQENFQGQGRGLGSGGQSGQFSGGPLREQSGLSSSKQISNQILPTEADFPQLPPATPSKQPPAQISRGLSQPGPHGVTGVLPQDPSSVGSSTTKTQGVPILIFGDVSYQSAEEFTPEDRRSSPGPRVALRPGRGQNGVYCEVKANHFHVTHHMKEALHQYNVTITPEVISRGVNRAIMKNLVHDYRSELGLRLPVYDGRKILYTAGPFPFISKEFQVSLPDEGDGSNAARRNRSFTVVIGFAKRLELLDLAEVPQELLQILDTVVRESPTKKYRPVGRSFYSPDLGKETLGDGLESWTGFYQSIRSTQMGLSLNVSMSSTAFIKPLPVIDFVSQLLRKDKSSLGHVLSELDRISIEKALKGVKVEVTHRGIRRPKYRISGLTSQPTKDLSFSVNEHGTFRTLTVTEYFRKQYQRSLCYLTLFCLQVGRGDRPTYLPMEVCEIVRGQRYSKRLNELQTTAMLNVATEKPKEREDKILKTVLCNSYKEDKYAKEFGLVIESKLARVKARILPAPRLMYRDHRRILKDYLPQKGQWSMIGKKLVDGGRVENWACINFSSQVGDEDAEEFYKELASTCSQYGINFKNEPVIPVRTGRRGQVEQDLRTVVENARRACKGVAEKDIQLLVVILPDKNGALYGDLKRICETDLDVVSQCCLTKNVVKKSKQYLANVALKINVKVGGRNTVLQDALSRRIPLLTDKPTIIFGADVTHPHPGEDSSPSIAAVVASQDWPEATKYAARVCAQTHRQELIQDLYKSWKDPERRVCSGGMIEDLLNSFYKSTKYRPERIIFFRDGVSEGQFNQVLLHELDAIRNACVSFGQSHAFVNYQPRVTFVVVQKRHHTRLFANDHGNDKSIDTSGNILPGTVVDTDICHPTEFDFYLCSHAGIKGTSRPAHYHVLFDENLFKADQLQSLTYNLCYTYARCTRSVSIVPPAYYAHLAAFRARFYLENKTSESGSTGAPAGDSNWSLPPLKDKVKEVMFYC